MVYAVDKSPGSTYEQLGDSASRYRAAVLSAASSLIVIRQGQAHYAPRAVPEEYATWTAIASEADLTWRTYTTSALRTRVSANIHWPPLANLQATGLHLDEFRLDDKSQERLESVTWGQTPMGVPCAFVGRAGSVACEHRPCLPAGETH
jgi:hypothetical protein